MNEMIKTQALATPALSKASYKPLAKCESLGEAFASLEFRERIAAAAPAHIKPGRLLQTFIGAVSKNPLLAQCSVREYIGASLTLSQTGFEANTALQHAFLIPFKSTKWNPVTRKREQDGVKINVIFGYPGLIDLSYRTGMVRNIHPDVVFPGDEFSFEYGSNAHLKHVPRQRRDGDTPLFAYMHASLKDGQAFEVMPYDEVVRIRNRSQAYRQALSNYEEAKSNGKNAPPSWTEAPWVAHEFAMARKTAVRAGSKWLPRSVELTSALAIDDLSGRQRVDFGAVLDAPTIDGTPDYLSAAADTLTETEEVETAATTVTHQVKLPDAPDAEQIARQAAEQAAAEAAAAAEKAARARAVAAEQAAQAERAAKARAKPVDKPAGQQIPTSLAERQQAPDPALDDPSDEDEPGAFEAVLIDAQGDVTSEPFSDPRAFVQAYLRLWQDAGDNRQALQEYNEDSLAFCLDDPQAAPLLHEAMNAAAAETTVKQNVKPLAPPVIQVIEPPVERGRIGWISYGKLMRNALNTLNADELGLWAAAQRDHLERCPISQRVLIVRAIYDCAGMHRIDAPLWLADLVRGKVVDAASKEAATPVNYDEPPAKSVDERWVDTQIATLAQIDTRADFKALVTSTAVKTVMARLRRDNKVLFDLADTAFTAKHHELPEEQEYEGA